MDDMHVIISDLIPIFIVVVLPITIVLIVSLTRMYADKKRSQVIIKALEANKDVDTDRLIESLKRPQKSAQEILNGRLLHGCIFSLIGIILLIDGIVNFAVGVKFTDEPVTIPFILGGISLAIGISFLIVFFITRKNIVNPEAQ